MPLQIQLGEIANRLRRALGVTGRIPTALDETVVPVAIVADSWDVPFALDPVYAAAGQDVTGLAAIRGQAAIVNIGPVGSVFIVEQLVMSHGSAGGRVEISRSGVLVGNAPTSTKRFADVTSPAPGAAGREVPVQFLAWNTPDLVTVGSICEVIVLPNLTTSLVLPVKHMLRAGEVLYLKTMENAARLIAGASGRFFSKLTDTGA